MSDFGREDYANRRLWPRHPAREDVGVACRAGTLGIGRDLALRLLDLSAVGACLLLEEPVEKGSLVMLDLRAPDRPQVLHRAGIVVWSTPAEEGARVGVVFAPALSTGELRELCDLAEKQDREPISLQGSASQV
jgi:hypothetical protein